MYVQRQRSYALPSCIHFSFCSAWSPNPSFDLDIRTLYSNTTDLAYAEYEITLVTLISMDITLETECSLATK